MKKSFLFLFWGISCGPDYASPKAQDFDELSGWGAGIEGFNPVDAGPIDTASGSSAFDGIYIGGYELTINLDDGTSCYCSESLTMAIENGDIQVGQATQCTMDCGYVSELRFDGVVQEDGSVSGPVVDEAAFGFGTPWNGMFTSDGTGSGQFSNTVDTNLGAATVDGTLTVFMQ